jgi:ketosteroid isomerase-like protein
MRAFSFGSSDEEKQAREILDAVYLAWTQADIEALLSHYHDDMTFWSNTGTDGKPFSISGKPAFAEFVRGLARESEGHSVVRQFGFENGVARAKVDYALRHKETKLNLLGSYRQVTTFRDGKILRVEQYHDAPRTTAFYQMVADEQEPKD